MLISEKIFSGFTSGDEKAFESIFRLYHKTLVSFCMRYGLEQMEAEDVVMEVLHHIWEIRYNVQSPAALHVLFFTSVRNRTMNILRNNKNRQRILDNQEKTDDDEFCDYLIEEEVSRLLSEAIEALPLQCREVILLLLAGKAVSDIAEQMNISASSVKTYKARAIEILKGVLKDHPFILWLIIFRLK